MEPGPEDPLLGPALAAVTADGPMNAEALASVLGTDPADADRVLLTLSDWDALVPVDDSDDTYRSRFEAAQAADPQALLAQARSVTYRGLSTTKRIALLSMGVIFNLVTAVLVFTVVLSAFGYWQDTGLVDSVAPRSAAESAGILPGDRIVSVENIPTPTFRDLIMAVGRFDPGDEVEVVFSRGDREIAASVTLGTHPEGGHAILGVTARSEQVQPSLWQAFALSFSFIGLTFVAIAGFFNPATFQASVSQSSSVIGAAVETARAAEQGPLDYAGIVAALSLSLGVINILPIPPLDGGKIAVELVEKLRGRPLSRGFSLGLSAAGTIMLFALIGYLMYTDVARIIAG